MKALIKVIQLVKNIKRTIRRKKLQNPRSTKSKNISTKNPRNRNQNLAPNLTQNPTQNQNPKINPKKRIKKRRKKRKKSHHHQRNPHVERNLLKNNPHNPKVQNPQVARIL